MRFKKYLSEEYLDSMKSRGHHVDIFVDPDVSELKSCGRNVRYIIDFNNKKIYAWNADYALHQDIILKLDLNLRKQIRGISERKGNKLTTHDIWGYSISREDLTLPWLPRYFDFSVIEYFENAGAFEEFHDV